MELQTLKENVNNLNNKVQQLKGAYQSEQLVYNSNIAKLEKLSTDSEIYSKAVELLSKVQAVTRDKIKNEFENLVTYVLRYITEEDYTFSLVFEKRGNLQELKFAIKTPDCEEELDPLDTRGGGIIDLVAFALRIVLIETSLPKNEGFILCDESFKHLSENYLPKIPLLINELSRKLNRQFIIISHEEAIIEGSFNKIEIK
jgi:hypothetical protein